MNVVICDDHRLFSDALAKVLTARSWNIITCAVDPAHAVAAVAREPAEACLMDLTFPNGDTGIEGIESVHAASPNTRVIVLTATSDPNLIMRAVEAGADAILFKDDDIDHIVDVVERGDHEMSHSALKYAEKASPHAGPANGADDLARFLTDREREVLDRLAHGESGKQLARNMGIAYSTARTHIQSVLAKLGVHSRLEAVAFAVENGLSPTPTERSSDPVQKPDGFANGSSGGASASTTASTPSAAARPS
jgi:two-component system, NarL family, nitrate/nitrite response regulator NarL